MKRRPVLVLGLIFVLVTMSALAIAVQKVEASGVIYIRADGSIDPPTALISSIDNITYTLADSICDQIEVQRSNIIIDGNGQTLNGSNVESSIGIHLVSVSNVTVKNACIASYAYGISLSQSSLNIISGNTIVNNSKGIYLDESSDNRMYHNNFINNTVQANVTLGYISTWDNNYPSGGNHWSDYTGTDYFKGSYQNITGKDSIGDMPYIIDPSNIDQYPLMTPYETEPPIITILSPENKTYGEHEIVKLTFTLSELPKWLGISFNGQANMTPPLGSSLIYNVPLFFPDGFYSVVIYANDTFGNIGISNTAYFTIDTTAPNITSITQIPFFSNVLPENEVKINSTIIDNLNGTKQVILNYTFTDNNGTWSQTVNMTNIEGNFWNATIPTLPYGTNVTYTIIAEDNAGNIVNSENLGYECQYCVISEFSLFFAPLLFTTATLLTAMLCRRRAET